MKVLLQLCRYLTGTLFIFSGLIKLNDPYGFSYKLKEYFEVFAADIGPFFHSFTPFALGLSFFICVLEIVLGVAVLVYYRMRLTTAVLMILIVFFTFLTFYSAFFEKVKECGCFGDFISLTPWQSFWKDIFLLVMILVLFVKRKTLDAGFNNLYGDIIVSISTIICVLLGYVSIQHLPFFDFRPYAVGKNICKQMKAEEAPRFIYIMEKDGKRYEFETYPSDTTYKYIDYRILNPEKSQPKIMDFQIWNEDGDATEYALKGRKLHIVIRDAADALDDRSVHDNMPDLLRLIADLEGTDIKPIVLTSSSSEDIEEFRHEVQLAVPYYFADETQLKTMIRANVGLILIDECVVKGKWHHNDVPDLE